MAALSQMTPDLYSEMFESTYAAQAVLMVLMNQYLDPDSLISSLGD